ncbi:MAG: L-threonylcarbamoyladenylate synthase [Gammaproteobacteria bacterium]
MKPPVAPSAAAKPWKLEQAAQVVRSGGVIAYPTEAVFGLGCDPENEQAVRRILDLKQRPVEKGVILIAADQRQLAPYLLPIRKEHQQQLDEYWPGPVTCVLPASDRAPKWITGGRPSIAVRVTAHPVVSALCQRAGMPLVSTSANKAGREPLRDAASVRKSLGHALDHIVNAPVGDLAEPTRIIDLASGKTLR